VDVCDKWADGSGRLAIIHEKSPADIQYYTFDQLKAYSNQFAHVLQQAGVVRGDRVGILLAQGIETAIAHIACYKLGLIAIPLFSLFGSDALAYRLSNSGARVLVTNTEGVAKLGSIATPLLELKTIVDIDATQNTPATLAFWPSLQQQPDSFEPARTL